MRLRPEYSAGTAWAASPAASTDRMPASLSCSMRQPREVRIRLVISTSPISGTLWSTDFPGASMAATISLVTAFLAPRTRISPLR